MLDFYAKVQRNSFNFELFSNSPDSLLTCGFVAQFVVRGGTGWNTFQEGNADEHKCNKRLTA